MALIQKIRDKSALVLILMALAIVSFIAMLITQDSNRTWGSLSDTTTVAKVAGQELDIKQLEATAQTMYGNNASDLGARNSLYNFFVENALITKEAEALGLGVCKDELLDLEFGPNPSPAITSNQGLMQNPEQLQQIKQAIQANTLPATGKLYWAEVEKQVIKDRLQTKINNLVSKAIYTPSWLVEEGYKELTQPVDFEFVRVAFDRVDDKDAVVTDADYEAYLKENKGRYETEEETRTAEFVTFDVIPSAADSAKILAKILENKELFRASTSDKDSAFAVSHGGSVSPTFLDKAAVVPAIKDSLFNAPIGTIVGPYIDNKVLTIAKLIDRRTSPDSVRSRHILLQGAGAQTTADSLRGLLEANAGLWDSLNVKFSTDQAAKMKGGDLAFQAQGTFVPEFNDFIFYKAQQGKFYTLPSQFGVHLIQVTGVKAGKNEARVKVAYVQEPIIPSQETDRAAATAADDLLASSKNLEELKANAKAKNLAIVPAAAFRANDQSLGALGMADGVRQIIRWAFESKAGERAKTTFGLRQQGEAYNSKYVVGALKNIIPKGVPALKDVKDQITPFVKNRKKGEVLKSKIAGSDLNAIATQFSSKVDTARGVTFNATMVPNLGSESKVVGAAFTSEVNQVTKPVVGESGVFVLKVTNKANVAANSPVDKATLSQQLSGSMKNQVRGFITRSLRKASSVEDNRAKFF
jgi:peptidyl-prolyl cis-trans isomerase D